jgi:hypothetical protein
MTYACVSFEDAAFYTRRKDGLPVVIAVELRSSPAGRGRSPQFRH